MNYLVFLDSNSGDLEKILSGVKTMVLKEIEPGHSQEYLVSQSDSLYFLRDINDYYLRVKATVSHSAVFTDGLDGDLRLFLKEMQPKLQLIENHYNYWSIKKQVLSVEFENAEKINSIQIAPFKNGDRPDWIAFEEFNLVVGKTVKYK